MANNYYSISNHLNRGWSRAELEPVQIPSSNVLNKGVIVVPFISHGYVTKFLTDAYITTSPDDIIHCTEIIARSIDKARSVDIDISGRPLILNREFVKEVFTKLGTGLDSISCESLIYTRTDANGKIIKTLNFMNQLKPVLDFERKNGELTVVNCEFVDEEKEEKEEEQKEPIQNDSIFGLEEEEKEIIVNSADEDINVNNDKKRRKKSDPHFFSVAQRKAAIKALLNDEILLTNGPLNVSVTQPMALRKSELFMLFNEGLGDLVPMIFEFVGINHRISTMGGVVMLNRETQYTSHQFHKEHPIKNVLNTFTPMILQTCESLEDIIALDIDIDYRNGKIILSQFQQMIESDVTQIYYTNEHLFTKNTFGALREIQQMIVEGPDFDPDAMWVMTTHSISPCLEFTSSESREYTSASTEIEKRKIIWEVIKRYKSNINVDDDERKSYDNDNDNDSEFCAALESTIILCFSSSVNKEMVERGLIKISIGDETYESSFKLLIGELARQTRNYSNGIRSALESHQVKICDYEKKLIIINANINSIEDELQKIDQEIMENQIKYNCRTQDTNYFNYYLMQNTILKDNKLRVTRSELVTELEVEKTRYKRFKIEIKSSMNKLVIYQQLLKEIKKGHQMCALRIKWDKKLCQTEKNNVIHAEVTYSMTGEVDNNNKPQFYREKDGQYKCNRLKHHKFMNNVNLNDIPSFRYCDGVLNFSQTEDDSILALNTEINRDMDKFRIYMEKDKKEKKVQWVYIPPVDKIINFASGSKDFEQSNRIFLCSTRSSCQSWIIYDENWNSLCIVSPQQKMLYRCPCETNLATQILNIFNDVSNIINQKMSLDEKAMNDGKQSMSHGYDEQDQLKLMSDVKSQINNNNNNRLYLANIDNVDVKERRKQLKMSKCLIGHNGWTLKNLSTSVDEGIKDQISDRTVIGPLTKVETRVVVDCGNILKDAYKLLARYGDGLNGHDDENRNILYTQQTRKINFNSNLVFKLMKASKGSVRNMKQFIVKNYYEKIYNQPVPFSYNIAIGSQQWKMVIATEEKQREISSESGESSLGTIANNYKQRTTRSLSSSTTLRQMGVIESVTLLTDTEQDEIGEERITRTYSSDTPDWQEIYNNRSRKG